MIFRFRSVALVVATAGYAHAAMSGDEKAGQLLIGSIPASAWSRPALVTLPPQGAPSRAVPVLAGFAPVLPSSFFGSSNGNSRLLFLSPLSPLRAALRVAAQDLALQTLTAFDAVQAEEPAASSEPEISADASAAARRREVILRQRRRSVLNETEAGGGRVNLAQSLDPGLEFSGLSGRVEILTLPSGTGASAASESSLPNGAGLVRLSGYLTDDLAFALTGLAAESAATTWRAGAEFELTAGDRNTFEVGAVYGTRFNTASLPVGGEIDRRSVGAFRLVHALKLFDNVTTRAGGRFVDAPFLRSSRSIDPELSVLIEDAMGDASGSSYLRLDLSGDTLFPGLEVVTGESDLIALSEGLPVFAAHFEPQRTWNRGVAVGLKGASTRMEARIQDQTVTHALLVFPSRSIGAPYVENGNRNRVQIGSVMIERTFGRGQAQTGIEYGYGRFGVDAARPGRPRDFHQITTRFDAYLRRSGTGIAIFHRFHEGASVADHDGATRPSTRAHRYLVELRQDVPFVPDIIGADMAFLLSLRNVYYDDVDRRSLDEFAVAAPPRRITGGIRVKF